MLRSTSVKAFRGTALGEVKALQDAYVTTRRGC